MLRVDGHCVVVPGVVWSPKPCGPLSHRKVPAVTSPPLFFDIGRPQTPPQPEFREYPE